jgi:hypothetical protein
LDIPEHLNCSANKKEKAEAGFLFPLGRKSVLVVGRAIYLA